MCSSDRTYLYRCGANVLSNISTRMNNENKNLKMDAKVFIQDTIITYSRKSKLAELIFSTKFRINKIQTKGRSSSYTLVETSK